MECRRAAAVAAQRHKGSIYSTVQCSALAACSCASSRALAHCCRARDSARSNAGGSAPALPAHCRSRGESAPVMLCGACPSSTRGESLPRSTAPARLGVCACQPARSASSAARVGAARAVWSCGEIFARSALRGLHRNVLQIARPTAQRAAHQKQRRACVDPAWPTRPSCPQGNSRPGDSGYVPHGDVGSRTYKRLPCSTVTTAAQPARARQCPSARSRAHGLPRDAPTANKTTASG